jgi:hypothetical protein
VERVDDSPAEEVLRVGRRGRLRVAGRRLAEQEPEARTGGAKLSRRRHREVELKRVGQQEDPVSGRTALEVGKVHRGELVDERARPVAEHVADRNVVGDAKGEVQVGEAIAAVHSKRADRGPGHHALIVLREP